MANENSKIPTPKNIPIEKIHDLPGMAEEKRPDKEYGSLVSSILINGVEEPVILRPMENGEYQLVAGYRRKRAVELAKLKELPALIYDMTEKEALEYRAKASKDPKTPVPGKLVEEAKAEADGKKTAPAAGKEAKPKAAPADEPKATDKKTVESASAPTTEEAPDKKAQKAAPAAPSVESTATKAEKAADTKKKEKKAAEPAVPAASDKEKKPAAKGKASAPKEEVPVGTVAVGPTGTTITKILESKLNPPTAKDKKSLPMPGEGEAFSVILHPAFLKKADINTFSVDREADDFKELYKSIERFGVKDPVLARIGADGELEILSGQRRHLIASELNYPVPTIIQQLDDDDARILVADGNLHREHISTYDQARALRMKADSMKRKAGRRSKGDNGPRMDTDEILAKEMGMSTSKLNRLMKLSEATKGVCELVDEGTLAPSIAYNIAFLRPQVQDMVVDLIGINIKVSNENTNRLKEVAKTEKLDYDKIRDVLEGKYPPRKAVEKPKPVEPAKTSEPATPSMVSTNIPKSPDVPAPSKAVPFPAATGKAPEPQPMPKASAAPVSTEPARDNEGQDRENSYVTKIVLTGDRLRKYFPDVSMTPREIEDSVYDALEERRQRQEKAKQKSEIFKDKKTPVR